MNEITAISVRIDKNIKAALERAAAADRRSLSSLVAKIFDEYLANPNQHSKGTKP